MEYTKEVKEQIVETEVEKPFIYIDYWNEDIEELDNDMKKKKFIVEKILKNNTQSRNSDFILFFECLRYEFKNIQVKENEDSITFKIPKKVFKMNISPESYRRTRQKLNQNGEYLPTKNSVLERRKRKEKAYKIYFGKLRENEI